jgi:hypothetical protein
MSGVGFQPQYFNIFNIFNGTWTQKTQRFPNLGPPQFPAVGYLNAEVSDHLFCSSGLPRISWPGKPTRGALPVQFQHLSSCERSCATCKLDIPSLTKVADFFAEHVGWQTGAMEANVRMHIQSYIHEYIYIYTSNT